MPEPPLAPPAPAPYVRTIWARWGDMDFNGHMRNTATGGWLDLRVRKLTAPPEELRAVLHGMPRAAEFAALDSLLRR